MHGITYKAILIAPIILLAISAMQTAFAYTPPFTITQLRQLGIINATTPQTQTCLPGYSLCNSSPWQEFAFVLNNDNSNSILNLLNIHYNFHSNVWHNEQGVFIPWSTLCNAQQSQGILQQSCSDLVDGNGLTQQGDRAIGCITNGAIITIGANKYHISTDTVKAALGFLAGPTGCSGIVNLDTISQFPQFQSLLNAMTPP
jgi:hypothetical protein